jgi:hypothetical protein
MARQVYGELVALRACHLPNDARAGREIKALLEPHLQGGVNYLDERIGLALAAAHLWDEPNATKLATDILVGLIPGATERLARAILSVFRFTEGFDLDDRTRRLLTAVVHNLTILAWLDNGDLFEHLEALLPHEADVVCKICRELVRLRGESLGSLQSGWALHASRLTTISITLQRLDSPIREMGLELFEAMLDLHLPDAEAALLEIDQRLPSPLTGIIPRPRRPRRSRRGGQTA